MRLFSLLLFPTFALAHEPVSVRKVTALPGTEFGYAAHLVPGSRWASIAPTGVSFWQQLETNQLVDMGVASELHFIPGEPRYAAFRGENGALTFVETSELLAHAENPGHVVAPFFADPEFAVAEPQLAVMSRGDKRSLLRTLTALPDGSLALRDYIVAHAPRDTVAHVTRDTVAQGAGGSRPAVIARSRVTAACTSLVGLTNARLSPDGNSLAANDAAGAHVFAMSPRNPANCVETISLGDRKGPISFSVDGLRLVFAEGASLYVFDVPRKITQELDLIAPLGFGVPWNPEFLADGSLVFTFAAQGVIWFVETDPLVSRGTPPEGGYTAPFFPVFPSRISPKPPIP